MPSYLMCPCGAKLRLPEQETFVVGKCPKCKQRFKLNSAGNGWDPATKSAGEQHSCLDAAHARQVASQAPAKYQTLITEAEIDDIRKSLSLFEKAEYLDLELRIAGRSDRTGYDALVHSPSGVLCIGAPSQSWEQAMEALLTFTRNAYPRSTHAMLGGSRSESHTSPENNASTECAPADNISTDNISTDNISTDNISTDNISTDNISTDNISTDNISTDNISTDNISTDNISTDNGSTDNASTDNVATDNVADQKPICEADIESIRTSLNRSERAVYRDCDLSIQVRADKLGYDAVVSSKAGIERIGKQGQSWHQAFYALLAHARTAYSPFTHEMPTTDLVSPPSAPTPAAAALTISTLPSWIASNNATPVLNEKGGLSRLPNTGEYPQKLMRLVFSLKGKQQFGKLDTAAQRLYQEGFFELAPEKQRIVVHNEQVVLAGLFNELLASYAETKPVPSSLAVAPPSPIQEKKNYKPPITRYPWQELAEKLVVHGLGDCKIAQFLPELRDIPRHVWRSNLAELSCGTTQGPIELSDQQHSLLLSALKTIQIARSPELTEDKYIVEIQIKSIFEMQQTSLQILSTSEHDELVQRLGQLKNLIVEQLNRDLNESDYSSLVNLIEGEDLRQLSTTDNSRGLWQLYYQQHADRATELLASRWQVGKTFMNTIRQHLASLQSDLTLDVSVVNTIRVCFAIVLIEREPFVTPMRSLRNLDREVELAGKANKRLSDYIYEVLLEEPNGLSIDSITRSVLQLGYESRSRNVQNVIYQTLHNSGDCRYDPLTRKHYLHKHVRDARQDMQGARGRADDFARQKDVLVNDSLEQFLSEG